MLHAHGARPSGIISVAKNLDEKELVRLAAWVKKHYSGLDNISRVMILDNDAKFTPFDMKGVDAEHIKLRNHEIESICHGMGVLPIVIGYPAEMAARAAAETLIAMHLVHTIRPCHRRFEKAFNRQCCRMPAFLNPSAISSTSRRYCALLETSYQSLRHACTAMDDGKILPNSATVWRACSICPVAP
jgi:phage portal protein BeeE